jgi:hypothetical protein
MLNLVNESAAFVSATMFAVQRGGRPAASSAANPAADLRSKDASLRLKRLVAQ